ncbi:hypothetical protein LFE_0628 [Leptospirillum ferrooxidans C2-3]|uniref:Uncharacterized protein n=1 Tax=Leptospirillum ferrooxidans (strain C2-3) TaxID=1162668 RepID=I0IM45_LEPFC|nr:hypothetical protein LFE_0628 [Leptospirillum ferrooxidans C2-3]
MRNAHLLIIVKRDSTEKVDFVSMAGVGGPREDRTPNPLIKSQDCIAINTCFLTTYPVSAKV